MATSPSDRIPSSEITPESVYLNRRNFMRAGLVAAAAVASGGVYRTLNAQPAAVKETAALSGLGGTDEDVATPAPEAPPSAGTETATPATGPAANSGFTVDEPKTSYQSITTYNNFYEFTTDKESVAAAAVGFSTAGWKVMVDGLCRKPRMFDLDDLLKVARPQERVYRMRCVEGWSMVIPWAGYSISKLLAKVEPMGDAKYVAFTTLLDPTRFPGQKTDVLNWPYVEGLRMDEAMHPLAILASGLYGKVLPGQDGAPIRLVTPWKYGFKGIKSIVKISLVAEQPPTTWSAYGPAEYGFYANVNPQVDHPRWSQATEQRIGESGRRPTLMFNGYAEQVGGMYAGMDLRKNF